MSLDIIRRKLIDRKIPKLLYVRLQTVFLFLQGTSRKDISRMTGCSISAIDRWISRYKKGGVTGLYPRKRLRPPHMTLSGKQKDAICSFVRSSLPTDVGITEDAWTIKSLKKYVKRRCRKIYKNDESYRRLLKLCQTAQKDKKSPFRQRS